MNESPSLPITRRTDRPEPASPRLTQPIVGVFIPPAEPRQRTRSGNRWNVPTAAQAQQRASEDKKR